MCVHVTVYEYKEDRLRARRKRRVQQSLSQQPSSDRVKRWYVGIAYMSNARYRISAIRVNSKRTQNVIDEVNRRHHRRRMLAAKTKIVEIGRHARWLCVSNLIRPYRYTHSIQHTYRTNQNRFLRRCEHFCRSFHNALFGVYESASQRRTVRMCGRDSVRECECDGNHVVDTKSTDRGMRFRETNKMSKI